MSELPSATVADACVRLDVPLRTIGRLTAVIPGARVAGPARTARHTGSVDVLLEALLSAPAGSVLVVDDAGRTDRACIGDLVALEASHLGASGIVVHGLHRDTDELREIGLPVFSLGAAPEGPVGSDPGSAVGCAIEIDGMELRDGEWLVADDDGVVVVPAERWREVAATARVIRDREREQAAAVRAGAPLTEQLRFGEYLERRARDAAYDFRAHLRSIGGAIEE